MKKKDTLCWGCQNACGNCPWSKDFTPVAGWKAEPTKIYDSETKGYIDSFCVIKCPMFLKDNDQPEILNISVELLSELLGVSVRTIYRYKKSGKLNEMLRG